MPAVVLHVPPPAVIGASEVVVSQMRLEEMGAESERRDSVVSDPMVCTTIEL